MSRPATPVGMRSDQASHRWVPIILGSGSVEDAEIVEVLKSQEPEQRRRDAEFSRKVRSTQA